MIEAIILVVFPLCMAFAAVSDLMSMTISNRVSIILIAAFAVAAPFTGMDWSTYALHFAAGLIVLLGTFGLFAAGGMGGGDAKLLSATALYMGLNIHLVEYLIASAVVGGVLTLAIVVLRHSPLSTVAGGNVYLRNLADPKKGVPYGIALAIGGLVIYPSTDLMTWAVQRLSGI
jgi:prepilin peptidase CpaA